MTPTTTEHTPTTPARVLVIDDETQIRRFLDISLRAQGYQVRQAATGQEGLQLAASEALTEDLGRTAKQSAAAYNAKALKRRWAEEQARRASSHGPPPPARRR